MAGNGNIYAYAGRCDQEAGGSQVWSFQPSKQGIGSGSGWRKSIISNAEPGGQRLTGANHLAAAVAYSNSNNGTDLYVFGGMCPDGTSTPIEDWTRAASYSNSMLALEVGASSNSGGYTLGISASRGPPVAEAGFTMTPLPPSFSHAGDGQQLTAQNYVLLGGHTQAAFINMSQVALFSLPEQSWSFLPVIQPGDQPKMDLAIRDDSFVEPRSGHTAVLTSDGTRVVVFGGWVGDVNTAAHPQLAVLELGEAYGGKGDWRWSIPDQTGLGLEQGTGMYGHGAVMLPGDVMMIIGGYMIPGHSTGSENKRAGLTDNVKAHFYNTTSKSWVSQYTHPANQLQHSIPADPGPRSITASKRAGLGAGLVFGILAIVTVVVLYFWYARRLKRKREVHEDDLRNLGAGGQRAHWSMAGGEGQDSVMTQRDLRDAYPWTDRHLPAVPSSSPDVGPPAQRTGLLFEIPSPTRGLRRSLHSRGAYQPAPRYDDSRINRSSGNIHPIDERDEYEDGPLDRPRSSGLSPAPRGDYRILQSVPVFDPFQDTTDVSRSPSPESPARERALEIQKWVNDWAAADARMHHQAGRLSPDKTDRTSSTLSEQSLRSNWSAHSVGSFSRSLSQRSAALFSHAHTSTNPMTNPSPANELQIASLVESKTKPDHRRSQSLMLPRRATTSDVIATGATSIRQLQQESEALLGGYSDVGPSSHRRTQSRARGWVGSVRRAFGGDRSASTSPVHGDSSASSSPTKLHHDTGLPRRAVSAGAALWQKRQGAKDWDVEGVLGEKGVAEDSGANVGEEEWDVESAVERRVVQVMFTVPRAKLRVVNGAAEGDGDSVLSNEVKDAEKDHGGTAKGKGKGMDKDA
ncbi:MAG: hypothetical protein LQ346_000694 [Caloplaca aetnensis]|nr:MAG: hypothetical protein LQ346_000694 [Caloplaca aetnensis]